MKTLVKQGLAAAMIVALGALPAKAAEYVMSASADYSGPFADVMPNAMSGILKLARTRSTFTNPGKLARFRARSKLAPSRSAP